jgi:hypothetical protein
MRFRSILGATAAVALLATTAGAARANTLVSAELTADCDGFTVDVSAALGFNYQGTLDYSITVNPAIPGSPIVRSIPIVGDTMNTIVSRSESVPWPSPLTGAVDVSGVVALSGTASQLAFNGGVPVSLDCDPDRPAIDIEKEISIDGGITWLDADDEASAPSVEAPHGADYRLIVTNTGNVALVNVVVSDASLGLVDVPVGDLAIGEEKILIYSTPGFEALNAPGRCLEAGTIVNMSDVAGTSATALPRVAEIVTDTDPALLICTERPEAARDARRLLEAGAPLRLVGDLRADRLVQHRLRDHGFLRQQDAPQRPEAGRWRREGARPPRGRGAPQRGKRRSRLRLLGRRGDCDRADRLLDPQLRAREERARGRERDALPAQVSSRSVAET